MDNRDNRDYKDNQGYNNNYQQPQRRVYQQRPNGNPYQPRQNGNPYQQRPPRQQNPYNQYNQYQPPEPEDDDEDDKPSIFGRIIKTVILLVCIGLLVYSGLYLYNTINKTRIPNNVVSEVLEDSDDGKTYLKLNWTALQETYPNIVAWIYIPHTDVNYPIVQSDESQPEYYLNHGAQNEPNDMGAIFLASEANSNFTDDNTLIYGHSVMYYGGMFTGLNRFQDDSHFDKNPYVYILTPKATYRGDIRVFAKTKEGTNYYVTNTNQWKDQSFAQWQLDNAMQKREEVKLPKGSNLITLSTCDLAEGGVYTTTRFVLQAKLEYYMEDVEYVDDDKQEMMRKMSNFLNESVNQFDKGKDSEQSEEDSN